MHRNYNLEEVAAKKVAAKRSMADCWTSIEVQVTKGFICGSIASLLVSKKVKSWPMFFGLGAGIGYALSVCERDPNLRTVSHIKSVIDTYKKDPSA